VAGRIFVVSAVALWYSFVTLPQASAADRASEEKEHRSQQVVIVKPEEFELTPEDKSAQETAELERTILGERHKKNLLELKLKSLKERVATERKRMYGEGRVGSEEVHPSSEYEDDSSVVREYIWVPEHKEGDKIVEGSYQLRAR
jgi:hypothetical protein